MEFKAYYLTPENTLEKDLTETKIKNAFESKKGLLWVDVTGITEDPNFLERNFHFHHLAIEDCVSPTIHSPKIDDLGSYLFIIVHGIYPLNEMSGVETAELALFVGTTFVISVHRKQLTCFECIRPLVEDEGRLLKRGADFLAHALIDEVIDDILPTIDRMSELSEDIEEETINEPQQKVLESILRLKRSTLRIHRVIAPQREIMNRLSRGEFPIIKDEARIFYRDVYDHLLRIEDLAQNIRDGADNALDTYMSSVANRQNEIVKVLSMVATIFLPLSLIAGIYGMNFEYMPGLKIPWGFFALLGLMILLAVSILIIFRLRRWIK
jgi:magnesium transporter